MRGFGKECWHERRHARFHQYDLEARELHEDAFSHQGRQRALEAEDVGCVVLKIPGRPADRGDGMPVGTARVKCER